MKSTGKRRLRIYDSFLFPVTVFLFWKIIINKNKVGAVSSIHDANYREKYSSLPHTVFAPDGKLYSVERAAQRTSDSLDTSSTVAISLHCGASDTNPGFIVLVSLGPCSPHLHYSDKCKTETDDSESGISEQDATATATSLMDIHDMYPIIPRPPISILHCPCLLAATGGTAVDSSILLKKIQDVSATLFEEHDTFIVNRQIVSFKSHTLARYCADLMQVPTQNAGGKTGRILASSALIIGTHEPSGHFIWRLDPTGQFYRVDVGIVGRGAGMMEAQLLRQIHESRINNQTVDEYDLIESKVSNDDVRSFLSKLTVEDSLILACRLLIILQNTDRTKTTAMHYVERGLQAVVVGRRPLPEVLTTSTLLKLMETALNQ